MINIRKLETELWESADLLRQGSKLTSNEYCMPVLGLIFLRYAYSRFKMVETEILKDRPVRGGRVLPVEPKDFKTKNALYLPEEARYNYLVTLSDDVNIGKAVNDAMELIEQQSPQLVGILPKTYTSFRDELLRELLRIFNNKTLDEVDGDIIGRIYEYFLSKFAPAVASDDGVFFTPKSLVQMIVNVIEPKRGILLDPACGSGGMFVQTGDFVNANGISANTAMTFYGQEKVEYNSKLCLMNMAVHGLNGNIKSGDEANTFYSDAHNLEGKCDYVMANPPFNVDKVKSESAYNAGRLPFGLPSVNDKKEVSNANYLWISYFYAYLNETGRAGFVMPASATDSGGKDREIRKQLLENGSVDVMLSVGNNFFYTKSLPCTLWFLDKAKNDDIIDKMLFIDAKNYYTVVDRTLNEWSPWQLKNLNAIVWLHRGETEKYLNLLKEYKQEILGRLTVLLVTMENDLALLERFADPLKELYKEIQTVLKEAFTLQNLYTLNDFLKKYISAMNEQSKALYSYGDGLEKDEVKTYVQKISQVLTTWTQFKRGTSATFESTIQEIKTCRKIIKDAKWLTEKFGDGTYQDVLGLCKSASHSEIEEKNYSFTPGVYVGVAPVVETEDNFAERMVELHNELLTLQTEENELMDKILANFAGLGL
ncbi:class I SAM-dependent DNA methyltransferase [Neobacillus sp. PS3-12]|uniref:type I restriction-modification system subunit M n=1 Tax=Neobacillus sp. PS3-12 TaxID=3070677 RepID=UPI0027DF8DFF|nr:class I SAM-dependent DNA methyltransferase [Neobacillus sp. PS3-12]WML51707.1 class I SAM-dependent DNA methyltransferase [Neobacillus sp. PS3-12]